MVVRIVKDNQHRYYTNRRFIENNGFKVIAEPDPIPYHRLFPARRKYDFVRTARVTIAREMVENLNGAQLPGLNGQDRLEIRAFFNDAFHYNAYIRHLEMIGDVHGESMNMFVFCPAQQYVAHVMFESNSSKNLVNLFGVNVTVTCRRYNYFPPQTDDTTDIDIDGI